MITGKREVIAASNPHETPSSEVTRLRRARRASSIGDVGNPVYVQPPRCAQDWMAPHQRWVAGAACTLLAAWISIWYIAPYVPSSIHMYVLQPLAWAIPASLLVVRARPRWRDARQTAGLAVIAIMIAAAQLSIASVMGILSGFARSPYQHDVTALIRNAWFVAVILIARETVRWFIVISLQRHGEVLAVGTGCLLFGLTSLPVGSFEQLASPDTAFAFIGRFVMPALASSLLASYLALRGGPLSSSAYLGALVIAEWLSPALPNLNWPLAALVGVLVPVIAITFTELPPDGADEAADDGSVGWTWILAAVCCMLVIWFNTGVFGVRPTVVSGSSMEPNMYTGDVAIVEQVEPKELRIGDVIRFKDGSRDVLHRIIEIHSDETDLFFVTKGDNNPTVDELVMATQVEGRLIARIPDVGWPGIYFKRAIGSIQQ